MFFNPLFIQTTSVDESATNIKQMKLSKDSYLFSDIIKLNYEKSKVGENDLLGSTSLDSLKSVVSSGSVIKKEELLDHFVGMPSLEMFTVVEPKVLNSLVERVFQSNNAIQETDGIFSFNQDVNITNDLKSEIYGNEEKLVEFLEQLLPGMALVDTTNTQTAETSDAATEETANLSLLPLPEKEKVIQDVLKRLQSGETVQIIAKVGDEKIRLDISKVESDENSIKVFSTSFGNKLAELSKPDNSTASANKSNGDSKVTLQEKLVAGVEESPEKNTKVVKNVNVPNEKSAVKSTTTEESFVKNVAPKSTEKQVNKSDLMSGTSVSGDMTDDVATESAKNQQKEMSKSDADSKINFQKDSGIIEGEDKQSLSKTESNFARVDEPKNPLNEKFNTEVKQSTDKNNVMNKEVKSSVNQLEAEKTESQDVKKESEILKSVESKIDKNISAIKKNGSDNSTDVSEAETTPKETVINDDYVKPNSEYNFEASRIALQSKSFKSFAKEVGAKSKEDKYKIEITQENSEEKSQKALNNSLEVDNLMNYKKQSAKLEGDAKANMIIKEEQVKQENEKITVKKETLTSEIKVEKSTPEVKTGHSFDTSNTFKSTNGIEKVFKNVESFKETFKTVQSSEIVKEVKTILQSSEHKTMILKIMPETLGKMKIMLDITEQKQVQANIEVENESVKQLLLANADTLKQAITQSGIQLGGFNISLSNSEQKMKREFDQRKKQGSGEVDIAVDEVKTEKTREKKLGYNTYEYLA